MPFSLVILLSLFIYPFIVESIAGTLCFKTPYIKKRKDEKSNNSCEQSPKHKQKISDYLKKMPYAKTGSNIRILAVGHLSCSTLDEGVYPIR
jgi:hypothetical protein